MKVIVAFGCVLALAGCAMEAKRPGAARTAAKPAVAQAAKSKTVPDPSLDDIAFGVAHAGAGPVSPENVYDRLFPINDGNTALVWKDPAKKQVLKVVTVMTLSSYDKYYKGQESGTSAAAGPPWVSAVPQLRQFCKGTGLNGEEVADRVKQWLGLNPAVPYAMAVELWVDRTDMLRPCPDPEITDTTCNIAFEMRNGLPVSPPVKGFPDKTGFGSYLEFFNSIYRQQYGATGDPWTRLGYTYDWNPATPIHGGSEYIVTPGRPYTIASVSTLESYCTR